MAASPALVEHCMELLSPLGTVRWRRMFSGCGFYVDELFIALIFRDRLYLKTDESSRPRFVAAGSEAFIYDSKAGAVSLGYWSAPADAMDSPALMEPWARLAVQAALSARAAKAPKRPVGARKAAPKAVKRPAAKPAATKAAAPPKRPSRPKASGRG